MNGSSREDLDTALLSRKAKDEEKGNEDSSSYAVWRSDLTEVCWLSGPACLQLFFQVNPASCRCWKANLDNISLLALKSHKRA